MIFHENRLPADDSHEISCLIVIFEKAAKFEIVVCCKVKVALYGLSFCCSAIFFSKFFFSKNSFRNTIRVSHSLDPDHLTP